MCEIRFAESGTGFVHIRTYARSTSDQLPCDVEIDGLPHVSTQSGHTDSELQGPFFQRYGVGLHFILHPLAFILRMEVKEAKEHRHHHQGQQGGTDHAAGEGEAEGEAGFDAVAEGE